MLSGGVPTPVGTSIYHVEIFCAHVKYGDKHNGDMGGAFKWVGQLKGRWV